MCHPDKAPPEHRQKAEARYKSIQKAYDVLSDPAGKISYDSQIDFDPSTPSLLELQVIQLKGVNPDISYYNKTDCVEEEDINLQLQKRIYVDEAKFYEIFGPVFKKYRFVCVYVGNILQYIYIIY